MKGLLNSALNLSAAVPLPAAMTFLFNFGSPDSGAEQRNSHVYNETQAVEDVPAAPAKLFTLNHQLRTKCLAVVAELVRCAARTPLYKRHVSDIKFEIASTDEMDDGKDGGNNNTLARAIVAQTDLVRGVYEGGLKTWECSIDLVNFLAELDPSSLAGKRIMELGCGSALPGIFCLMQGAAVDFQDYNDDVIQLVTIPNVLLNTTLSSSQVNIDSSGMFDAQIHFKDLDTIPARYWSGDWGRLTTEFSQITHTDKYDIILTSESIYAAEAHDRLLTLIKTIIKPGGVVYVEFAFSTTKQLLG
ncbi:Histidine protein methyltransferase 1 [Borealophlyctis nickersoniae]|nr:Histidine protein methyltransferase 1 [Borealophlyctis nickersoniae]